MSAPLPIPPVSEISDRRQILLSQIVAPVNIGRQLKVVWRRRHILMGVTATVMAVAWLAIKLTTPIYSGSSLVMIDTRKTHIVDIKEVMSSVAPQLTTVLSEVEVLKSRNLAKKVADKLNLYSNPEFNPAMRPAPSGPAALIKAVRGWFETGQSVDPEEKARRERSAVIAEVMNRRTVAPVPQSMVIMITTTSPDAKMAASLANAFAEAYVLDQLEAKFDAARDASTWLNQRVDGLRQALLESERAVTTYRSQTGLLDSRGGLQPSQQQLAELNSQIIITQARRSELEAKVVRIESVMRSDGGQSLDESTDSPLIQRLRESEATLLREVSDMSIRYGDKHPRMIKASAELAELREKIRIESAKLGSGVRHELGIVRAREAALRDQVRKIEERMAGQGRAEVRLHELEREAQANRLMYETFLARSKETSEQEHIQRADSRVISTAEQPISPSYPRKGLLLAAALLVGLFLGVVIILVLEQFEDSFRDQRDLEDASGLPALGLIPLITPRKLKAAGCGVEQYMIDRPTSAYSEAVRSLWVTLSHGAAGAPRVLAVTSAVPGEGKSLTAVSLARTAAGLGRRVVLVDCDLRRSSIARMLSLSPSVHLDALLLGGSLEEALIDDKIANLKIIAARSLDQPMLEQLGSSAMTRLIETLKERFDLIVLDCPPVMPVSETQILGRMADAALFCVRWENTARDVVTSALHILSEIRVNLVGTVLTQVNVERHATYGYGDKGQYYGRYKAYYRD